METFVPSTMRLAFPVTGQRNTSSGKLRTENLSHLKHPGKKLGSPFTSAGESKNLPFSYQNFNFFRSLPYYDERFKGFGFDRIQQVCELYVAGYTMKVLSESFVVHDDWKRPALGAEITPKDSFNWYLFNYHFKDELQRKYNTSKTCSPLPQDSQMVSVQELTFLSR